MSMETFGPGAPRQERKQEEPEIITKYRELVATIEKVAEGIFGGEASQEDYDELQKNAVALAKEDLHFRELLEHTFKEALEGGTARASSKRWVDQVFIDAFKKFDEAHQTH